ncbi:MAG: dephospho-CoA kinase [Clostridiales Family XIII bacterium]|jgi:dephospho-CoA kinase|nr:dephospho-CoA kinase [Clostridiales Family XIII bacterium]
MIIGIAGGIGAGKSAVTDYLRQEGYTVIDADEVAREAVMKGEPALAELAREFGEGIIRADGTLDRAALAALAFADDSGTEKLNVIMRGDIVHRIKLSLSDLGKRCPPPSAAFLSAPLLFESGLDRLCDETWLVSAPDEIRFARAAKRDGTGEAAIRARAEKQLPETERRVRADRIIENTGSRARLLAEVDRLLAERGL